MNSKTSFFKPVIFKKDLTRLWPVWVLNAVILFFALPFQAYLHLGELRNLIDQGMSVYDTAAWDAQAGGLTVASSPVLICFLALLAANAVFFYLFSPRSTNMMHAWPVSRNELFAMHYISGFCFLAIPQIVMFLIALPGYAMQGIQPGEILPALGYALAMDLIFYSIAVLCCFFAGHVVSSVVWFVILNGLYCVLKILIHITINAFCYGGSYSFQPEPSNLDFLFPGMCLLMNTGIENAYASSGTITDGMALRYNGWGIVAGYCIMAAVLIGISLCLYRKRHLENAGEMNAFRFLNPVERWIVAFCGGGVFAWLLTELTGEGHVGLAAFLIFFIIFNFAWYLISAIVQKKSFRVFGRRFWLEWILLIAISAALILVLALKVSGDRERYVPKLEDVEAASISASYEIYADEEKEIQEIIGLHQTLIRNKEQDSTLLKEKEVSRGETGGEGALVSINYVLRDGTAVQRAYSIWIDGETLKDPESTQSRLAEIEDDENRALEFAVCTDYEKVKFTRGTLTTLTTEDQRNETKLDKDTAADVFTAIRKDMKEENLPYHISIRYRSGREFADSYVAVTLELNGEVNGRAGTWDVMHDKDARYYPLQDLSWGGTALTKGICSATGSSNRNTITYCTTVLDLNPNCTHTIAALKKHGIRIPKDAWQPKG